ncbi:SDR family oxidoreductase [Actinacidiphila sp. bgisy145]|uniref:SDR family oxidoreductase n=1 Tax=Actinacidiphila sp. bgisy145 TaxID=3413792 RepID=UPI003EBA490D
MSQAQSGASQAGGAPAGAPQGSGPALAGRVALVTGASSGIGRATALAVAEQGGAVAVTARRADRLEELAGGIRARGGSVLVLPADLSDPAQVDAVVEHTVGHFGRLDVLVNNAAASAPGFVEHSDPARWDTLVEVNFRAVLRLSHTALPHLLRAADGPAGVADVVNISSVVGRKPIKGNAVYSAAKHAVIAFGDAFRQEVALRKVRVGVVEPGMVATDMTVGTGVGDEAGHTMTERDWLHVDDVARAVVFMVTQPRHSAVSEILLRPTAQEY